MLKLLVLLFFISCSTLKPENLQRAPASLIGQQLSTAEGRQTFRTGMMKYITDVKKIMEKAEPDKEWFKLCGKKSKKTFTLREALTCHDQFASNYFIDIDHLNIVQGLEPSDFRALKNNMYIYPSLVIGHYEKIVQSYEKE